MVDLESVHFWELSFRCDQLYHGLSTNVCKFHTNEMYGTQRPLSEVLLLLVQSSSMHSAQCCPYHVLDYHDHLYLYHHFYHLYHLADAWDNSC